MSDDKPVPRILQQPPSQGDPQQQRDGATGAPSSPDAAPPQAQGEVEGEGSYSATRNYQKDIKDYLDRADVQADAEAAKPRSEAEARALEQAEREGKSHSKGER